ncbi:MAG: hypothetical protein GXO39_06370, partial [Thermotogae bacterium]|nr:hypothetical protein [Thermotogota bacterium]
MKRGFSTISAIAAAFGLIALGLALMIMTTEGFKISKSHENALIAEVNAEHGVWEAILSIIGGSDCNGTVSGSINGGSYEATFYPVGSLCLILGKGEKDEATHFKISYVDVENSASLATLTVNYFTGNTFFLSFSARIKGDDDCGAPALAYYRCGNVCIALNWAVSTGRIESVDELKKPINIEDTLFQSGVELEDLKNFVLEKFNETYPDEGSFDGNCIIENATSCTVSSQVVCDSGTVDTAACDNVLIKGSTVSVTIAQPVNSSITVSATDDVSVTLNN